jgi:hypothetical protein
MQVSMERWWNDIDGGKTEVLGDKLVSVTICPQKIAHGLVRDRIRDFPVRGQRLTA